MIKNKIFSYIGFGPSKQEIIKKEKEKECSFVCVNEFGEYQFCCPNKCLPYEIHVAPLVQPIKFWIYQGMICKSCLTKLTKKYEINFEEEIPRLHLNKNWKNVDKKNYKKYLLMESVSKILTNNKLLEINVSPEICLWKNSKWLMGIPIFWLKNFIVERTFLKGSSEQGRFNGPDYIFKNIMNNKIIGLEIVSWKWNVMDSFRENDQIKEFAKKHIFNSKSFEDDLNVLKQIVFDKSKKKYIKCDEIYLGIVVGDTIVDYQYYVIELILNKFIVDNKFLFKGVFIL